jgi:hypothetical protein
VSQSQLIADLSKSALGLLKNHLADLTDADLMTRPVPAANHGLWQLCHLARFEAMLAKQVSPEHPFALPANFTDVGGKDSAGNNDPNAFPTKAGVIDVLEQAHAAQLEGLPKLTDDDLAKPSPEHFRSFAPRLGDLLAMGPMHAMMHLGQIQVLRRALGKPNVF